MAKDDNSKSMVPSVMRAVFGIIMVIVYVGMGVLFLINFFGWGDGIYYWLRMVGGIVFIVYGIWRAYRQFRGIDSAI